MDNTKTIINDNEFLLELEGLIDTPTSQNTSKIEIDINEKIEVSSSDNLDDIFSEIHDELNSHDNVICSKQESITTQNISIDNKLECKSVPNSTETQKSKSKILSGIFF
jgi:hypothetical protein